METSEAVTGYRMMDLKQNEDTRKELGITDMILTPWRRVLLVKLTVAQ
jgi:hypothetical protein